MVRLADSEEGHEEIAGAVGDWSADEETVVFGGSNGGLDVDKVYKKSLLVSLTTHPLLSVGAAGQWTSSTVALDIRQRNRFKARTEQVT